jgi:hypothetical protein
MSPPVQNYVAAVTAQPGIFAGSHRFGIFGAERSARRLHWAKAAKNDQLLSLVDASIPVTLALASG